MGYRHVDHANDLEPSTGHAWLRENAPLHWESDHEPPFAVVSRHEDVLGILKQPAQWGNKDGPGVFYQQGGVLGAADDPDHNRQRKVLRDAFKPSTIAKLEPRVAALSDELFDSFADRGEGDFVDLYAFPLPALVIAEVLGVDPSDRADFRRWADDVVNALGGGDMEAYEDATRAIWDYVDRMVDKRLGNSDAPDDVVTRMVRAHEAGVLERQEIRQLSHQLLVAGHETTTGLIGLMLWRLMQRPELFDRLREDRSLVEACVEEALRFDSPVQGLFRTNASGCPVRGHEVPAGTKLQVMFASANRDAAVWDAPDEFRLDRDLGQLRQHVAFGWGVHYCIGAPLARLEARISLDRILDRLPDVELAGEPQLNAPFILRGFISLPIRWRA